MNSTSGVFLQEREKDIKTYALPLPEHGSLLDPKNVLLDFGKGEGVLDFGARCYLKRDFGVRPRGKGAQVDPSSLDEERQRHIFLAIKTVDRQIKLKAKRPRTLFNQYFNFLKFVDWCDSEERHALLRSSDEMRQALKAFISMLRHRVELHEISPNTAQIIQKDAINVLTEVYGTDGLTTGINLIRRDNQLVESTQTPDEAAVGKNLRWCECILSGLGDMLLNDRPYPFALTVPRYLVLPSNRLWVFPGAVWAAVPGKTTARTSVHYDHENGRIRTTEEAALFSSQRLGLLRRHNKHTLELVDVANANPAHHSRLELGMLAMKCYLFLLIAASGQSLSTVTGLPWNEDLESQARKKTPTRQQFRSIKYRAGGAEISFEVGADSIAHLQSYLRLRKYLLQGRECGFLFFNFGTNRQSSLPERILGTSAIAELHKTLRRLDPGLPKVSARELRAAKGDFLIRTTDPSTAAQLMQHSEETSRRWYNNGSRTTHLVEFSALLNAVEKKINDSSIPEEARDVEERAGGSCRSPKCPQPIIDRPPALPDCRAPEGCFFCRHYYVHADEQDIQKLLSARMCIRYRATNTPNREEAEQFYGPVLSMIEALLDEIRRTEDDLIIETERKVEILGELTPYWSAKIRVLTELEALL